MKKDSFSLFEVETIETLERITTHLMAAQISAFRPVESGDKIEHHLPRFAFVSVQAAQELLKCIYHEQGLRSFAQELVDSFAEELVDDSAHGEGELE